MSQDHCRRDHLHRSDYPGRRPKSKSVPRQERGDEVFNLVASLAFLLIVSAYTAEMIWEAFTLYH